MKEQTSEQISAMVDGEIKASRIEAIVNQMKHDPDAIGQWDRYHLIRDVLNNNAPKYINGDFASRIMDRISGEAEIIALPQPSTPRLPGMVKQLVGLSIAASVAVVSLLTYESLIQPGIERGSPSVATVSNEVEVDKPVALAQQKNPADDTNQILNQRINNYLVNHNEYAISNGMRGMPPYIRLVSQEKP